MLSINPLPMSLSILAISIMTSILIFKKAMISWLAFIFILTFASGMMTLFVYISSLTPNEKMKMSKKNLYIMVVILLTSIPMSDSNMMKMSMKSFSGQTAFLVMAMVIISSMIAISMQGYHPIHAASSNF